MPLLLGRHPAASRATLSQQRSHPQAMPLWPDRSIAPTLAKRQDAASTRIFWNSAKKVGFHVHFSGPFSIFKLGTCISLSLLVASRGQHLAKGGLRPSTS